MALKDNVEILALVDLRVPQDIEEMLGLQEYLELKDQWVIEVQMVSLEELVPVVSQDLKVMQDGVGYLEMLVLLGLLDHLAVSVTI